MKYVTKLNGREKISLYELMRTSNSFKVRQRAHAILLSAKKIRIDLLSDIFEVDRDTVSEWLRRWSEKGIQGLADAPRSGRPRKENEVEA
jgi:transposase